MPEKDHKYVIVGAGLAGASAITGIRELDKEGSVLLIGAEKHLPYDRPPLSKELWFGKKTVEKIFFRDQGFYASENADLALGVEVIRLDAANKTVVTSEGDSYKYEKLLLATGGTPRALDIRASDLNGVCYYRYLDDYLALRQGASEGKSAVVIGGGFIGSEMAAALNANNVDVTMIFPGPYLVQRVFPEGLGRAIQARYIERGVKILASEVPVSIARTGNRFVTHTRIGRQIESDLVIAGIGITPSVNLARMAGLALENGIVVDEHLRTSNPDIYAAGDNACFPYPALGQRMRVEHWDNARKQGKHAGRNMAGANEPFTYMPYFFSDLFEFGYEAVGAVTTEHETFADWQKENETGVVYYLKDGRVVGAMMCGVWKKLEAARELIRNASRVTPEDLRGAIK